MHSSKIHAIELGKAAVWKIFHVDLYILCHCILTLLKAILIEISRTIFGIVIIRFDGNDNKVKYLIQRPGA